jgi:hypothetical protein
MVLLKKIKLLNKKNKNKNFLKGNTTENAKDR